MVRTRGLGRVLDRVIGKALGREDNHDFDKVSQRRRPTASAHRQCEAIAIAEDAPHVADAAEEVFQQLEEVVVDAQGFPGRLHNTLVLTVYADHVAIIERPELKLSSHGRKVQKFGRPTAEIEGLVAATGLTIEDLYRLLWRGDIRKLAVGEVTITLDEVASLLHLPIIGTFPSFETLHVDKAVLMLVELLEVSGDEARAKIMKFVQCWIYKQFPSIVVAFTDEDYDERSPRAYRWTSTKALPTSTYCKHLDRLITTDKIPPYSPGSRLCLEDIDDRWMHFSYYLAPMGNIYVVPGQCAPDYMDWFYMISHPFLRLTQPEDPPRHPPVVQDETYV
ncbi:hypothetical protein GmHk_20G057812 [Glycine max]|nr:hypothetical protein GmHk_20G057812 [Glycine max]